MTGSDDEDPQLCPATLAALNEFLREKEERERELKRHLESETLDVTFDENWQLSQFWYDEETVDTLVRGILNSTVSNGSVALISCPSLYGKLKQNCGKRRVTLFEFDERFQVYGDDFVPYDYKSPLNVPRDLSNSYDLVVTDPPFLSDECLTKTALTVKFLAKRNIVLCTGGVMGELAGRLLDVQACNFVPRHRNNLANEFHCYSNFDFDAKLRR